MPNLDTDTARIVAHLADIQAKIADLTSEAEGLKAELRQLPPADYEIDGKPALRLIPTRRFDVNGAASLLDPDTRQTCLAVAYDAAKVKQHLTPAQVDAHMIEAGKPKVVIL